MTKPKSIPVLCSSIHTFEVHGTYRSDTVSVILMKKMNELICERKYWRMKKSKSRKKPYYKKYQNFVRNGGGLKIESYINDMTGEYNINLYGINLARISGETSRLELTDLSYKGLERQGRCFEEELERLGLLELEDRIEWKMYRVDLTQDFYVKSDPSLYVRIAKYTGEVRPNKTGKAKHYERHNEKRSATFEKDEYNFELYDKHQQLMNEGKIYPVTEEDLVFSRNLVRFEVQLKRPFLLRFERQNGLICSDVEKCIPMKFRTGVLVYYFMRLADQIPWILYDKTKRMFGEEPWHNVDSALQVVNESRLSEGTKSFVRRYIESVDHPECSKEYSYNEMIRLRRVLKSLKINPVIIPRKILNNREVARFPCKPLCERVEGCR